MNSFEKNPNLQYKLSNHILTWLQQPGWRTSLHRQIYRQIYINAT